MNTTYSGRLDLLRDIGNQASELTNLRIQCLLCFLLSLKNRNMCFPLRYLQLLDDLLNVPQTTFYRLI